jgi:hypothetical protein
VLKLVILGIWVIAVTAGATFGAVHLRALSSEVNRGKQEDLGVEELKAEMTSIPMIRGGEIIGYLIIQLSFQADRRLLGEKKLEPMPYINDAAFRAIFASTDVDFRRLRGSDLDRLTAAILKEANNRIGGEMVRQVLIQQLNFVPREDIRTNWIGNENPQ